MRSFSLGLLLLGLFNSFNCRAEYFKSPLNSSKLSTLSVHTEIKNTNLLTLAGANKPVLLIPAYFSCKSTCPLMIENLRNAIEGLKENTELQIIVLSFNKFDKAQDIKMFKNHHHLPSHWILAIADEESKVKELLNPLGYQFQKTVNGFDHPNSAFFFSRKKRTWTGLIVGLNNKTEDIQKAIFDAEHTDSDQFVQSLSQFFTQPEYLIVISLMGLFVSLFTVMFILLRRDKRVAVNRNIISSNAPVFSRINRK
ncbi:MAG: SCO family protein [Pseudobdellovibrionaceae bacterium]